MDENTEEFAYPRNYGALRNQITDIANLSIASLGLMSLQKL